MNPEPQTNEYEPPEIVDYGDLEELAAGLSTGTSLDPAYHSFLAAARVRGPG